MVSLRQDDWSYQQIANVLGRGAGTVYSHLNPDARRRYNEVSALDHYRNLDERRACKLLYQREHPDETRARSRHWAKVYYWNDPVSGRAKTRQWRVDHLEEIHAYDRRRWRPRSSAALARQRQRRAEGGEEVRIRERAYRARNRDRINAQKRRYSAERRRNGNTSI